MGEFNTLGIRISDLIISSEITQKDVVNYCNKNGCKCSEATISDLCKDVDKGYSYKIIRCIAQMFNVSTDYLLGLSDVSTTDTDLQGVCEYTGLSEVAVKEIHNDHRKSISSSLSILIENGKDRGLFDYINSYFYSSYIEIAKNLDEAENALNGGDEDIMKYMNEDNNFTKIHTFRNNKLKTLTYGGIQDMFENVCIIQIQNTLRIIKEKYIQELANNGND